MTHLHPVVPLRLIEGASPDEVIRVYSCEGTVVKCRGCGEDRCLTECPERDYPDHCPAEAKWLDAQRSASFCCLAGAIASPGPCPWQHVHEENRKHD